MYHTKHLLSKTCKTKNYGKIDSKGPFCKPPPARPLISRSWPTGWRELLPGRPEMFISSNWTTPIAVLHTPLQKASFYHQFFTLLHFSPQAQEARSAVGRLAGQIHCRKPIKKRKHSRKNRMQKPPWYFCRARLRSRGATTNPSRIHKKWQASR